MLNTLNKTLKSKKVAWIIAVIGSISFVWILLYAAVTIPSFGMWFYRWQYSVNDTYAWVGMYPDHLHEVTQHLIKYMRNITDRDKGLQIMTIVGGEYRYFFSDLEIRHMVDVWDLFNIARQLTILMLCKLSLAVIYFKSWGREVYKTIAVKALQIVSISVATVLAVLIIAIAVNWARAWVVFHEILFNNNYWILDPRVDLLIRIVPYDFFITLSVVIGIIFGFGILNMIIMTTLLLVKNNTSKSVDK